MLQIPPNILQVGSKQGTALVPYLHILFLLSLYLKGAQTFDILSSESVHF